MDLKEMTGAEVSDANHVVRIQHLLSEIVPSTGLLKDLNLVIAHYAAAHTMRYDLIDAGFTGLVYTHLAYMGRHSLQEAFMATWTLSLRGQVSSERRRMWHCGISQSRDFGKWICRITSTGFVDAKDVSSTGFFIGNTARFECFDLFVDTIVFTADLERGSLSATVRHPDGKETQYPHLFDGLGNLADWYPFFYSI